MRYVWLATLLLANTAWSQTQPPATPDNNNPQATQKHAATKHDDDDDQDKPRRKDKDDDDDKPKASASASTPVITVKGFCPAKKKAAECETVVTKSQFETLADTIAPGMSPQTRRTLANSYPKLMVMSHNAELRGLDKTQRFNELLHFARMQILAQELVRQLKEQTSKVSDQDIADYYKSHSADFEVATIERLFVPLRKEPAPGNPQTGPKNGDPELKALAVKLDERAKAGEDFAKLQSEAYAAADSKAAGGSAPQKLRRSNLPPDQASVFDMKSGEVSPVITNPGGQYIYKMDSKEMQPLDAARREIIAAIQAQRLHDVMDKIDKSYTVDINEPYFDALSPKRDADDD